MSTTATVGMKRRRLGLTVRGWLGVVAGVALGFGLLNWLVIDPQRRERRAVQTLTTLGGNLPMVDWTPTWVERLGITWFDFRTVWCADLDHSRVTDADLALLSDFHHNGQVYLRGTAITEAGVRHFDKLELVMIDLSDCRITSADLTPAHQVVAMILAGNPLKELRLTHFAGALSTLDLSRTGIDDTTLGPVSQLVSLRDLDLSETNVTDDGLIRHLIGLPNLAWLNVGGTEVKQGAIDQLSKLKPGLTVIRKPGIKTKLMNVPRPVRPVDLDAPK